MSRQMSLFPAQDLPDEHHVLPEAENNVLDELLAASPSLRDRRGYRELLDFLARFPQYSPFNAFLLYLQNPYLSFVATAGAWQKRFARRPKKNARPLIILAPMSPVRFVYDIGDTEGEPVPAAAFQPQTATDLKAADMFEKVVHNCSVHGIIVREVAVTRPAPQSALHLTEDIRSHYRNLDLDAKMSYLILLDADYTMPDKYAALVHEIGRIFCGHQGSDKNAWWPDRQQARATAKTIEADSVAFLACRRNGFVHPAQKYLAQAFSVGPPLLPFGFNAVLQAVHYIEKMGRSLWKKPAKTP